MFKVSNNFKWKVEFAYAVDGEFVDQAFTAKFRRLPLEDFAERLGNIQDAESASDRARTMKEFLREVFLDFEDVEFDGDDRNAVKDELIRDTTVANAIFEAYTEALSGALRTKNSETPPEQ